VPHTEIPDNTEDPESGAVKSKRHGCRSLQGAGCSPACSTRFPAGYLGTLIAQAQTPAGVYAALIYAVPSGRAAVRALVMSMITATAQGRNVKKDHPETWRTIIITIIAIAWMTTNIIAVAWKALPGSDCVVLRLPLSKMRRAMIITIITMSQMIMTIIAIARMTMNITAEAQKALPRSE
jgi:hypothetical protein